MSRKKRSKLAAILMTAFMLTGSLAIGPFALADEDGGGEHETMSGDGGYDSDGGHHDGRGNGGLDQNYNWDPNGIQGQNPNQGQEDDELDFLTDDIADDAAEAQRGLTRALERLTANPANPEAVVKVAELYAKLGQWDKVKELALQLEAAAAIKDDAANLLAAIQLQQGDLQTALADLQQALQDGTATPDTYRLLGLINARKGDWYEALQGYAQAATADPTNPDVYKDLGKAYREMLKGLGELRDKVFKDVELDDIPVFINGRQVKFEDVPPQIVGDRTMVPVRKLVEHLGAQVSWDPVTRTVTITNPAGVTVQMTIDSSQATVNGQPVTLDVAPVIIGGRTLFPARFLAEALGFQVGWEPTYRLVTVTQSGSGTTGTNTTGTSTTGGTGTQPTTP